MHLRPSAALLLILAAAACSTTSSPVRTRGAGVYPGDPAECFAPSTAPGGPEYRNLALLRAAFNSSSYDYNLTAQLVTDGIVPPAPAPWAELTVGGEKVERRRRHYLSDLNVSSVSCPGPEAEYRLDFHGYCVTADRILVAGNAPEGTTVSMDGVPGAAAGVPTREWVGKNTLIRHAKEWELPLDGAKPLDGVTIHVNSPKEGEISINEIFFYKDGKVCDPLPNALFSSSWKSLGAEDEWISVDLGAKSRLERMVFHWLNPPVSGKIQVSDDGKRWKDVRTLGPENEISLPRTRGRYVRALLERTADGEPFELGEWEIWGRGGVKAVPSEAAPREGRHQPLSGGDWKLLRASLTGASGEEISSPEFDDSLWLAATVPGTVLGSFINAGAVPDPNYADNQLMISDSYFRSDFWYRDSFEASTSGSARQFLRFRGVNYRAGIWLNGRYVGEIRGAFRSKSFDVTGLLVDGHNCLAVKIFCNDNYGTAKEQNAYTPDNNGGIVGYDNPTMHATIGWDWIPTVRGRCMGIYDEVSLLFTGEVTVEDPFVRAELPLPDTSSAKIFSSVRLVNHADSPVSGVLHESFGDVSLEKAVSLGGGESTLVELEPFVLENPRLWWPHGYGEPALYDVSFSFVPEGEAVSDSAAFRTGIRQMDCVIEPYTPLSGTVFEERDKNRRLSLYVNGRRFIGFGGNWGFPEHLLNYRSREYDIAVGNHAAMNFTMIRDWVGMTDHPAFYEACDKYGVMIWQDFWLANPWDGPDPRDPGLFNEVAEEYVRRIRNHPSIALYVGRNEGYPPEEIDGFLREAIRKEHPGMAYIPHSAADGVSGGGPYHALPAKDYYTLYGKDKFHSERGMPNVMNYEDLVRALGEENAEPFSSVAHPNPMYGLHDFALGREGYSAAQQAESFNEMLSKAFGEPSNAKEFTRLAQWVNYEGYRAMFEGRSEFRRGLILWMTHPAWPSMVWQTYDYYFEPTGAWFGCRKACEPIHILLNALTGNVDVVNYRAGDLSGLTASATVYDLSGKPVAEQSSGLDIREDDTRTCFALELPSDISEVYFVRLILTAADGAVLSENTYIRGREEGNLKALRSLPLPNIGLAAVPSSDLGAFPAGFEDGREVICMRVCIANRSRTPAAMLRLKALDRKTGELVLPVWYSDNYITLMPGESRTLTVCVRREDCSGRLRFEVESIV